MKRFLGSLLFIGVLLGALALGGCGSKAEVAMTVNGVDVPQGVLNYYINYGKDYLASYGIDAADPENGAQYMALIEEQGVDIVTEIAVVRSLAKEAGITVDADALNESFAAEKGYFSDDAAWQDWLGTYEISESDVRWILEYQLLADALYDHLNADIRLTDEQAAEAYNADPTKYDSYKFAHILIAPQGEDEAAWEQARQTAEAALKAINDGSKSFEELAAEHNPDSTQATGGDLGQYVTEAESPYVESFSTAAFGLSEIGQVTAEPVRSDFGYHLIKLLDKREGLEAARETIEEELLGETRYANYNAKINEALETAEISKEYQRKYAPAEPENQGQAENAGGQQ